MATETPTLDLLTTARLVALTGRGFQTVQQQLDAAGIRPHMLLNGVAHYPADAALAALNVAKPAPKCRAALAAKPKGAK